MPLRFVLWGCLIVLGYKGIGQYSESEVIEKIHSLQVRSDLFYDQGLFPTKRTWSFSSEAVEDNTIFFTASTIVTLQTIRPLFNPTQLAAVDKMIQLAKPTYEKYRSRNGEVTYNFWQTVSPDLPFPNGNKLISNSKMRLPDDYDTSLLIALADGKKTPDDSLLRKKMVSYARRANRSESELTTLDKYKDSKAYEVWFAKKMPQTLDICVMSNVLFFAFQNRFLLNDIDQETISLILQMIASNDHLERARAISHHTSSPPVILYHVSRMIAYDYQGVFDGIKDQLIEDGIRLLEESDGQMEKVLLLTSLYRLGHTSEKQQIDELLLADETKSFSLFTVNPFQQNFTKGLNHVLPTISWQNEAYNWTLFLEYLMLKKSSPNY